MDSKKLAKIILETMALKNLAGNSAETIAMLIEKDLNMPNVKRKSIEKVIKSLIEEGKLKTVKLKGKNNVGIVFAEVEKQGVLFVISKTSGGYIVPSGTNKKIPISYEECKNYSTGDVVGYKIDENGNAGVVAILSKKEKLDSGLTVNTSDVVTGTVYKNEYGHYMFYAADNKRYPKPMVIVNELSFKNLEGRLVAAVISDHTKNDAVKVTEDLGNIGDPIAEVNAIAKEAGVNMLTTNQILEAIQKIDTSVDLTKYNLVDESGNLLSDFKPNRLNIVDMRDKLFATIDPIDCRDMDDAVYTEIDKDGNYVTYSAIADITEYIKPGSVLWNWAISQGFAFYTPYSVFPMFPKELANGILSINPGEDRLTLCVKTVIDKRTGKHIPNKTEIVNAVINSKQKFSYEEVQKLTEDNNVNQVIDKLIKVSDTNTTIVPKTLLDAVTLNTVCSNLIWKNFKNRGVLSVGNDDELKFVLNQDGTKVLDIVPKKHLKSMEMIEALMINSNEAVAEFTFKNKLNSIYRVHDCPSQEKVERLTKILNTLGIEFNGDCSNSNLQKIISKCTGSELESVVKELVLRTQAKAVYLNTPHPIDQFGEEKTERVCHSALNSELYSHFTSGIRRTPDIITQYAVKNYIHKGINYFSEAYVSDIAMLASAQENKIESAERKIKDFYSAVWAEDHINTVMQGNVVGFKGRTVIVKNPEKGIRVFIPLDEICLDGKLDDQGVAVYNTKGQVVLKLCDNLTFKISGADRVSKTIYASTNLEQTFTNIFAASAESQTNGLVEAMKGFKSTSTPQISTKNKGKGK